MADALKVDEKQRLAHALTVQCRGSEGVCPGLMRPRIPDVLSRGRAEAGLLRAFGAFRDASSGGCGA